MIRNGAPSIRPSRSQSPRRRKTEVLAGEAEVVRYIDLKLAALGHPICRQADSDFLAIARPLLRNYHQKDLMLGNLLCPADRRIQTFWTTI